MANDITQRPWLLDTAATPIKPAMNLGAAVTNNSPVFCTGFVFRDYAGGAASRAVLSDSRGKVIARLFGNAAGTPVGEGWIATQAIYGLALTSIDSGVVEVLLAGSGTW